MPRSAPGEISPAFVRKVNRGDMTGLSGLQLTEGRTRRRKVRRRAKRLPRGRGWISLNDGPGFALDVARYLEMSGYG